MHAPAAPRSFARNARRVLLGGVALYALLVLALALFQRSLIYQPERLAGVPLEALRPGEEFVTFPSSDGVKISGLLVRPRTPEMPVVLVAHGNAGNAFTWRGFLTPFLKWGTGAFLLDPRGYGASDGDPDEAGWQRDAEAAVEWLDKQGIPSTRLVVVGVSLGAGLALPIAARHPVRGLILQSAFTSLADMASARFPFVPCRLLLRDRYDNLAAAPSVRCPVLILHGTADEIVPVAQARRLADAFPTVPSLRLAPGAGHDDVAAWPGYGAALQEFLNTLP